MSTKDPRREELIQPYVRAHPDREVAEPFGASAAQMMSMGVMVMRSKHVAWLSFLISLSAWFRDRPSVSAKTGKGPWMSIMISLSSLLVAYMSMLMPTPTRSPLGKLGSPASAPAPSPVPPPS